jgi:2-iminobutanoate/2-iminopropanoate deaminase
VTGHIKSNHTILKEHKMSKNIVYEPSIAIPCAAYSQAVETDALVFCSGQLAFDAKTDTVFPSTAAQQTERLLKNLEAILKAAGLQFKDVVKTTLYLTDMSDFTAVNQVYARYFSKNPPARSTIGVAALAKGAKVEIEAIASLY